MPPVDPARLRVIGVRHHAPACARLVRAVIEELRPRHVLVEGPADFNPRLGELFLGHRLPIAIFTHLQSEDRRHASWTPLCEHSPEWVALETARAVGAEARFCDLPAWHPAFEDRMNRYGDRDGAADRARAGRAMAALCARTHTDDVDALWDHLFEQPLDAAALEARLGVYFDALRGQAPGGDRDGPREAFMARWAAWALHDAAARGDRGVVLVCGGWHARPVADEARLLAARSVVAEPPAIDPPPPGARHGSDLVPYTYRRLDAFAGYDSGMPSPAYQGWVWSEGHAAAAELATTAVAARVRGLGQPLSTADLVAARALTGAIAALRGHAVPTRTDVLDGLASALVKGGLDVPVPWAQRGPLRPRTEPILVEVVAALAGDRYGELAPGTPRPPLAADVARELAQHDLAPRAARRSITLSLRDPVGRSRSRVLHRLAVLDVPGFTRARGPTWATDALLDEAWTIAAPLEQEPAILEASQWGATLEGAALARLEAVLLEAGGDLGALADLLGRAVFVGIGGLAPRVVDEVARAVGSETSLARLGAAAQRLLDLSLHGDLLAAAHAPPVDAVLVAALDRGLWLLEGITGARLDEAEVHAVVALRDVIARGPPGAAALRARADGVFARRSLDPSSPPAIRGACLGARWSLGSLGDPHHAAALAAEAVRRASLPATLGDFLAGLFAAARAAVLEAPALVEAIDAALVRLSDHETMVALPSLRLAFAYFPPRDRERIARTVAGIHGADAAAAGALVQRLEASAADVAAGLALDDAVAALATAHGLSDALDAEAG